MSSNGCVANAVSVVVGGRGVLRRTKDSGPGTGGHGNAPRSRVSYESLWGFRV